MAQQFTPSFKVCPSCGQRLAQTMTVCGHCNTVQTFIQPDPSAALASSQLPSARRERLVWITTLTVTVLVFSCIVVTQIRSNNELKEQHQKDISYTSTVNAIHQAQIQRGQAFVPPPQPASQPPLNQSPSPQESVSQYLVFLAQFDSTRHELQKRMLIDNLKKLSEQSFKEVNSDIAPPPLVFDTHEWDRQSAVFLSKECPEVCKELKLKYITALDDTRDYTIEAIHPNISQSDHTNMQQDMNEIRQTTKKRDMQWKATMADADAALLRLCQQQGIPKSFTIFAE